ncbi:MAG: indolepyruvate ferredoxin oxidoreductase family protein [Cytophagales bacterium]|nr:indolepyruvate ferredoxin oxidoreductase family protein [Cytophagales bacterium]
MTTTPSLNDKYTQTDGWIYLSGNQALVRLAIQQRLRDAAAGHNTGAYVSGYRGSPLGRFDMEMWRAQSILQAQNIHFRAAVNEDLAATALWGSQYIGSFPGNKVDGVFGIWYGKGPGVDRSGDVFRHANSAGTSPLGGVVALAGDDHGAKSSTIVNFSDQIFQATGMPVLYPANTQELLDFGLHAIAMSRFSGCWVGMKVVTDVVEGGGTIYAGLDSPKIVLPELEASSALGLQGRSIRAVDTMLPQEDRLYNHKLHAALAYVRANRLNQVTHGHEARGSGQRLGIISSGKAYQDLLQALSELGLTSERLATLEVTIAKIGCTWPLDPDFVRTFASGLETLLVIEEKRPLLEDQIKASLFDTALRPRIIGKYAGNHAYASDRGAGVMPSTGETNPALIAKSLVELLGLQPAHCTNAVRPKLVDGLPNKGINQLSPNGATAVIRAPSFCSGCPHNRSTKLPEGSRALAGIGCHTIAMLQSPLTTTTVSHMGGEGAMWLGQQPFTEEKHVFANMGDGTYFHSGFLAIRQAIAAHAPMTYKILVNGFVSMTGGQPVDGELTIPRMAAELVAEGAKEVVVVSDDPDKYTNTPELQLPPSVKVYHRSELALVQRRLREISDLTILIYDQACATERRRLRKRGKWVDPQKRSFINTAVCEGCGDCGKVSNCMSIEPVETVLGRKRRINQGSCNKDFTCVEGFCPSFVTVHGGTLRKRPNTPRPELGEGLAHKDFDKRHSNGKTWDIPSPTIQRPTNKAISILITGIGGTGVVTIGQTLGMAAHLDGLRCTILDVTGLAQKYGAVMSHVRIAADEALLGANRISTGETDTLIGCDLIVSSGAECMNTLRAGKTRVAICTDLVPTAEFARNPEWDADAEGLLAKIRHQIDRQNDSQMDGEGFFSAPALAWATQLMGDSIAANMMMLGAAWQRGWVPVSLTGLHTAIELNGVQVAQSKEAFEWGRRAAHDKTHPEVAAAPVRPEPVEGSPRKDFDKLNPNSMRAVQWLPRQTQTLDELIAHRTALLFDYGGKRQGTVLAKRYQSLLAKVHASQATSDKLLRAVAAQYFRLLAVKDEWEVARLYAAPEFAGQLQETFEGTHGRDYKLHFHLGAWPFAKTDAATGHPSKVELGSWILPVFKLMAKLRGLRGSLLDPFRFSQERLLANQLLAQYESDMNEALSKLNAHNLEVVIALARLPEKIKGFGHVRTNYAQVAAKEREGLKLSL